MSLESTNDDSDDEDLAIDYSNSLMAFRRLYTTNKERFEKLNWIGVDRKIIDKLFPVDVKYGKNPHPSAYLVSAAKAREWRRLSNIDQVNKNKELKEQEEKIERENRGRQIGKGGQADAEVTIFCAHLPSKSQLRRNQDEDKIRRSRHQEFRKKEMMKVVISFNLVLDRIHVNQLSC